MKKLLVIAAVVAALAAPAAKAATAAGPQGYLQFGGAWLTGSGSTAHLSVGTGGGAVAFPLGTLTAELEGTVAELQGFGNRVSYARGMAHVFYRTPGVAIGGFGGGENVNLHAGSGSSFNVWTVGGEAQAYLGAINLTGQVAEQWASVSGTTFTQWYARGSVQVFVTDNFALQADVKYESKTLFLGNGATTIGGSAIYRVNGTPFALFGTVRRTSAAGSSVSGHITTALVGLSLQLGNSTLKQQFTKGASFTTMPLIF